MKHRRKPPQLPLCLFLAATAVSLEYPMTTQPLMQRGKAHTSLSGHHALTYTLIEAPERIRLAHRVEQQSRKAVKGYVEDVCTEV
jgi:hypothetical protein